MDQRIQTKSVPAPSPMEGASFKVVPHSGAKQLVVFLTAALGQGTPTNTFNYWGAGNTLPVHRIFVTNGPRNEWYQDGIPGLGSSVPDTLSTLTQWGRHFGVEETLFVGTSMGAYGAILFGAQMNARVLAFGPETTIMLPSSRSEKMIHRDTTVRYPSLHAMIKNSSRPVTVFCSERDPIDLYCMSLAKDLPNYVARPMRWASHGVAGHLHNRKRLVPLLNNFIEGTPLGPMPEDGNILDRRGFAEAFYKLHVAHTKGEWKAAAKIASGLSEGNSQSDHVYVLLGQSLIKLDRYEEALQAFSTANAILPDTREILFFIGSTYRLLRDYDQALRFHKRTIKLFPKEPKVYYELSLIYSKLGLYKRAYSNALAASRLVPSNKVYAKAVRDCKARVDAVPTDFSKEAIRFRSVYG
ncbi:tetratricopeptide repeat protein [Mesorhizobium sp. LHD-90]|uniref:tetratricopeptide repeat protein n=1 Tax=Mesorhizobium sp. LHD-90 TaxID=3071414 RepID=UPI0027DFD480|nr:tetratricopeptide repeat protein [Mesorhizobium sp. LHD-90]MDQ6433009.1 tetratricopeptide repeat protein [Mesorhizobium sp. LHD-90]